MSSRMHRQGDLLLTAIDQLPEGLTLQPDNVIVMGEATGHAHRLQEGRVFVDEQGNLFLEVPMPTQVVHQEHQPIALQSGILPGDTTARICPRNAWSGQKRRRGDEAEERK